MTARGFAFFIAGSTTLSAAEVLVADRNATSEAGDVAEEAVAAVAAVVDAAEERDTVLGTINAFAEASAASRGVSFLFLAFLPVPVARTFVVCPLAFRDFAGSE
jgi:hypothetical protein